MRWIRLWHVVVFVILLCLVFFLIWPGGIATGWGWAWFHNHDTQSTVVITPPAPTEKPQDIQALVDKAVKEALASLPTPAPVVTEAPKTTEVVPTAVVTTEPEKANVLATTGTIDNPNGWTGTFYEGVTPQIQSWMNGLKTPDMGWSEPPNADSPSHAFVKANGMYWPNGESHYGQLGSRADLNVPALHIRVYTGDFALSGIGECHRSAKTDPGCALVIANVGDMTAMFRDGMFDYGWTTTGPYFNGDQMIQTLWAVSSHVTYNMLNVAGGTNLGANCSVAEGCPGVRFTLAIISGNQVLAIATTTVK